MTTWVERQLIESTRWKGESEIQSCWHFVANTLSGVFGIEVPSFTDGDNWDDYELERLARDWEQVDRDQRRQGDVCIVARGAGAVPHVGIVTPDRKVMHWQKGQAVVEPLDGPAWKRRACVFYRHVG